MKLTVSVGLIKLPLNCAKVNSMLCNNVKLFAAKTITAPKCSKFKVLAVLEVVNSVEVRPLL